MSKKQKKAKRLRSSSSISKRVPAAPLASLHYAPAVPIGQPDAHCVFGMEFETSRDPIALKLSASDLAFLSVGVLSGLEQELAAVPGSRKLKAAEKIELHGIGAGVDETRRLLRTIEHTLAKLLHQERRKG